MTPTELDDLLAADWRRLEALLAEMNADFKALWAELRPVLDAEFSELNGMLAEMDGKRRQPRQD